MMKLVTVDGLVITADAVCAPDTPMAGEDARRAAAQDARRTAALAFLKEAGLTLDDRLLSEDVQSIIDGLMVTDAASRAA